MKILVALLLVSALLLGCAQNGNGLPAPAVTAGVAVPGEEPAQNAAAIIEENISGNETYIEPPLPEEYNDPFANMVPRNVSGKIGDGQFRINEQAGLPLNIYAINAGQADSILVNKGEFYMLIDAGNSGAAETFLKQMKINRLNVLVATKDDPGAIGGMLRVLGSFAVDEFWDNNAPASSGEYAAVLADVQERGITVKHPQAGDSLKTNGLEITILNPPEQRLYNNPDNDAIVMELRNGDFCAVLLNPTIQERESALMGSGADLRCDVATYFKHGEGRPTPSLLVPNYIKPKDVIISVGPNREKLPSETTITRLTMEGAEIWRTDEGTVYVRAESSGNYNVSAVAYNEAEGGFVTVKS